MTYHVEELKSPRTCHKCGEPAVILLVADYEDESGYTDEVALCSDCVREQGE